MKNSVDVLPTPLWLMKKGVPSHALNIRVSPVQFWGAPYLSKLRGLRSSVDPSSFVLKYPMAHSRHSSKQNITFTQAEYHNRCVTQSQRRYLKAIESLARVRRLLKPVAQVNVGVNQVNVAGNVDLIPDRVN